jgi:hypothetical protein
MDALTTRPLPTLGHRGESAESDRVPPAEAIARRRDMAELFAGIKRVLGEADAAK